MKYSEVGINEYFTLNTDRVCRKVSSKMFLIKRGIDDYDYMVVEGDYQVFQIQPQFYLKLWYNA